MDQLVRNHGMETDFSFVSHGESQLRPCLYLQYVTPVDRPRKVWLVGRRRLHKLVYPPDLLKRSRIPMTIHQHEALATVPLRQTPTYILSERLLELKEVLRQDSPLVVTTSLVRRIRDHVSEQVADPFGSYPGCVLIRGDHTSWLSEDAEAFEELLDALWRPEGFELAAVRLQAAELALCDGICNPVLMAIDEIAELLASRATNAHNSLSGNV